MKSISFIVFVVLASLLVSSCEWVNQPVNVMHVEVQNNHNYQLDDLVVTLRLQGDLENFTYEIGTLGANEETSQSLPVETKDFDVFEASIQYKTEVSDGAGGTISLELTEPQLIEDPVGMDEYHSFRALAPADFIARIEVDPPAAEASPPQPEHRLWVGYRVTD